MNIPSIHPMLALPIAAISGVMVAAFRALAAVDINGNTSVQLVIVVAAMIAIVKFVVWFSTEQERSRASRAAQNELLRLIVHRSRDIDERDHDVQRLLINLKHAEGKPPKETNAK